MPPEEEYNMKEKEYKKAYPYYGDSYKEFNKQYKGKKTYIFETIILASLIAITIIATMI